MAELRATPYANPLTGLSNDVIQGLLGYMKDKRRTQQLQGLAGLLESTGIPQTVERAAYAESPTGLLNALTNVNRANVPLLKSETADAAMTLAPFAAPVNRALMQATKGLPVGASIKNVGTKLKVKPPTDDIYEVMDATFEFGKLGGNKTLPIDQLTGGVRMTDPKEVKRVKDLAEKISSPDGYVSRIIVDDLGNVLEGQHRLEALRLLGEKNVPVAVIEDLGNKYDIPAMKKAFEGKFRSDEARQLLKHSIDTLEEAGSIDKALSDFAMPTRFQKPFEDAIKASKIKPSYPQQEALDTAQRNAALPIEEGGLGLPKDNTPMDRAKAMGFDAEALHGSPSPYIESFDPMMAGRNTGNAFDNNIFATTSPESATGYALNWKHYRNVIKTSPEYKAITREENALLRDIGNLREEGNVQGVADARAKLDVLSEQKNAIYNDFMAGKLGSEGSSVYPLMVRSEDFLPYEAEGANWMRANRPAIDAAEEQGYSGAVIKNVRDNAGANLGTIADVYASPDPSRFRSRFAALDPMRRNEADILAGVLPLGLLADEEQRKKLYELMPSLLGE